jgi:hypothetical protein
MKKIATALILLYLSTGVANSQTLNAPSPPTVNPVHSGAYLTRKAEVATEIVSYIQAGIELPTCEIATQAWNKAETDRAANQSATDSDRFWWGPWGVTPRDNSKQMAMLFYSAEAAQRLCGNSSLVENLEKRFNAAVPSEELPSNRKR